MKIRSVLPVAIAGFHMYIHPVCRTTALVDGSHDVDSILETHGSCLFNSETPFGGSWSLFATALVHQENITHGEHSIRN